MIFICFGHFWIFTDSKAHFAQQVERFQLNKKYKVYLYYTIDKFDYVTEYDLTVSVIWS